MSIEPRETKELTIIDCIPVLTQTVTNVAVPVVNHVPLVDPSGELVLNDQGDPITYRVMESVEVCYRRHLVRPAGNRYSFRMDQLALFCLRGLLTHQVG